MGEIRQRMATVVLRHETGEGFHYDWMIERPGGSLATWRIDRPPREWRGGGEAALTLLKDHRRAYLTYEGRLSGGRGVVRRVDRGFAQVVEWSPRRIMLDVRMRAWHGRVLLRRERGAAWSGRAL